MTSTTVLSCWNGTGWTVQARRGPHYYRYYETSRHLRWWTDRRRRRERSRSVAEVSTNWPHALSSSLDADGKKAGGLTTIGSSTTSTALGPSQSGTPPASTATSHDDVGLAPSDRAVRPDAVLVVASGRGKSARRRCRRPSHRASTASNQPLRPDAVERPYGAAFAPRGPGRRRGVSMRGIACVVSARRIVSGLPVGFRM